MNRSDVIVVGGGISGLMAARELAKGGLTVTVLEARGRLGGRIHTEYDEQFGYIELGAEFVHGNLPITLELLKESGIEYHQAGGEMWHAENGELKKEGFFTEGWDAFAEKLGALEADMTIEAFLQQYFPGNEYEGLKKSVRRYAAGYDTADPAKASAFALRKEWLDEDSDDSAQYRIDNGYGELIDFLAKESGAAIIMDSPVQKINWEKDSVIAQTADGRIYQAKKVVLTVPVSILQAKGDAAIQFVPELKEQHDAIDNMGIGAIIKILIGFKEAFWETEERKNIGFVISGEKVPTWWMQTPRHSAVITGWLGGPPAAELKNATGDEILSLAITSLAHIFSKSEEELRAMMLMHKVMNWTNERYTLGSYFYATVGSAAAIETLSKPVSNTIYFSGEAMFTGPEMGTVEAALWSGREAARQVLKKAQP